MPLPLLIPLFGRMLVLLVIKIVLWVVSFALLFAAWREWKKGADTRDNGTMAGLIFGAWLCYTITGQF